jgi:hypothetical protein
MNLKNLSIDLPLAISAALLFTSPTSSNGQEVAGNWISIVEGFGGQANSSSVSFNQDGAALSGSYEDGFGSAQIEEGKAEGGAVSFKITREFGERKMISAFSGKLDGKAIKGTLSIEGRDGPREVNWEAYRTPEVDPSGLWTWKTTSRRDGSARNSWVKLKFAKGELTETYITERGEVAIKAPALDGKTISFKVERGFGDRVSATEYHGTLDGTGIRGSIKSRRGEEQREVEWVASRETPDADPVGNWAWTTRWGGDGEGFESTVAIKRDGDSLTGSYNGRGGEAPISDAKIEGNVLSFKVTSENDRGTFTSSYRGEIDGDSFEPLVTMQFGEREFKRSITAKRVLPKAEPVGVWTWATRRGRDGGETESKLSLKRSDDGQLAGTLARGDSESPVGNVKLEGNEITFTTERSFGDRSITVRYQGTVREDKIKGTIRMGDSDANAGAWASFWSAQRSN